MAYQTLYNNYPSYGSYTVPTTYPAPNYYQNSQQYQTAVPLPNNNVQNVTQSGIQWVQGKSAAQAFYVPPGQTILLMDSETPTLYLKTTDQSGRPMPMVIYDLVEHKEENIQAEVQTKEPDLSEYVKRSEIEELIDKKISDLQFTTSKRKGGSE